MSVLPETGTRRLYRRWPGYALAVMAVAALLLGAWSLLQEESFSPGEEIYAAGFEDIAVSTEDAPYPSSDVQRFEGGPDAVYVYVTVENLPRGEDMEATVERSGRQSVLSWILGERDSLKVLDDGRERLDPSGVVKFAVRAGSGRPLPAGNYTVSVYADPGGARGGEVAARKHFVIRD